MAKQLVNFLIDQKDLKNLNRISGMLGRTRTSILVELIRQYCVDQAVEYNRRSRQMDELNQAWDQNRSILDRYQAPSPTHDSDDDMGLPTIFHSDGHDDLF